MNAGTKYIKFEMPSSKMKKKISTAECAEAAEVLMGKDPKPKSFYESTHQVHKFMLMHNENR
jgi:hypothetical protein